MTNWLDALLALAPQATSAVLVTVASVQGSTPREAGAKMVVTAVGQFDTIGGGHLEMQACTVARAMLKPGTARRRLQRCALGPSLGQCCGGTVELAFERIEEQDHACLRALAAQRKAGQDAWRIVALDGAHDTLLLDAAGRVLAGPDQGQPRFAPDAPCQLLRDDGGKRWLVDPCRIARAHLLLFGAGHVGAALVRALADLPCRVTWVDEREDLFPPMLPANVNIECTDTPEAVVDAAAAGTSFLVMTHSHALDQRLAEAILRRDDTLWFGLIGSRTKRARFEHRLRARGICKRRLQEMACPIGLSGISGKAPAVIAASVCAQLLQVWEAAEREHAIPHVHNSTLPALA